MPLWSIDEISVSSKYLRIDDDVENLMRSIKAIGLISPLVVNKEKELLAGGRRYTALKKLGIDKVQVVVSSRGEIEQELISIDENLVRKALDRLEFESCLRRGKELYETLYPQTKVDNINDIVKKNDEELEEIEKEKGKRHFIEEAAEKTGLSKRQIKEAIERDQFSSVKVKKARNSGELNASQVNQLINLSKGDQDELLPHVVDRPVKEIRALIKDVQSHGVDQALRNMDGRYEPPKEFRELKSLAKKLDQVSRKIVLEELDYDGGDELDSFFKEVESLNESLFILREHLGLT